MNAASLPLISYRTLITDAVILMAVYLIPTLAHLVPFPLHLFEPMRILLVLGMLIARNGLNTYLLAISIPLASTVLAGHPPVSKAILMSGELWINIALLIWLSQRFGWNGGLAFFVSTLISKLAYYGMKFVFLQAGFIEGSLISTPLINQLIAILILSVIYWLTIQCLPGSNQPPSHREKMA